MHDAPSTEQGAQRHGRLAREHDPHRDVEGAATGGAITLFAATYLGVPVSTTHTITGAIVGVGAARRTSAVRWGVARRIVFAWIVTMPMAGLIAALLYLVGGSLFPS